ncbi:MAG: glycosyltransferase family 1 protein [Anaerolineae bacterium]|nr:glycosyltransferase family 1 protein [Anaerolineae bacterium]
MSAHLDKRSIERSITFLASGTRGDVQPYVALARELQRRGQPATIATHAAFRPLVEKSDLPFVLLDANPSDLLAQPRYSAALRMGRNPLRSLRATLGYLREGRVWYARLLGSAWEACHNAKLVIGGVPTLWAGSIAEALGVPHVFAFLQPVGRTAAFPSTLLPITRTLGAFGNAASHRVFEQAIWLPWRNVINHWREHTLGLPATQASPLRHLHQQPVLYGYSAYVAPKPEDWPAHHHLTGYWLSDKTQPLSEEVERFLAIGDAVIYIGFGMGSVQRPQAMLQMIGHALAETKLRAIVLWSPPLPPSSEQVLFIAEAAHTALFPRMRAIVHHGGAGTTAQALCAGVPSVVLPAMADQYFWGGRVAALGVGTRPIPQHLLTTTQLIHTLRQASQDSDLREHAQTLGARVRAQEGVARAADFIIDSFK